MKQITTIIATVLIATLTLLAAHQPLNSIDSTTAIKSYRNQYTLIVNQYLSSTNYMERVALKHKLEELKQSNLHLFKSSK